MAKTNTAFISLMVFLAIAVTALCAITFYFAYLPSTLSQHETIVLGQSRYTPGGTSALRVLVRDSKDSEPIENALVRVSLRSSENTQPIELYKGETDQNGTAQVAFTIPEDAGPAPTLLIETQSQLGASTVERAITTQRDFRILITTDKPVYQPGQVIHLRTLALSSFDLVPASGEIIEFIIADGKGNKVFRSRQTASEYGVASVDFQLADEVNTGPYKLSAVLGNSSSEKTVSVQYYVLPKFNILINTERTYYLPGQKVRASLEAGYFYGKPVSTGQVSIDGFTYDVERSTLFNLQGETDETGRFEFEFVVPAYLAGSDLESGLGRFYLQATVTDQAQHSESANLSLPISQDSLVIDAIPEGGQFRPGVENILYVLASYPDGTPADASLSIWYSDHVIPISAVSGPYGIARATLIPEAYERNVVIEAKDGQGNQTRREFSFEQQYMPETILLRPEHPVYQVGDTMSLTVLTSQPQGSVYLDIVRAGQTLSTRVVDIKNGQGQLAVDLTPDMFGTLEMHAYKILTSGSIARDTRLVVVDQADDLHVEMQPGKASYLPGESAILDINVRDRGGVGVQSVLGLAIVDESVFALADSDPGFARLYFLLESQIVQPHFDLHGYSVPALMKDEYYDSELQQAYEGAAFAALAQAAPKKGLFSLNANSHEEMIAKARQQREQFFAKFGWWVTLVSAGTSITIFGLSLVMLWRRKRFWLDLGAAIILLVVTAVFNIVLLPVGIFVTGAILIAILVMLVLLLVDSLNRKDLFQVLVLALDLAGAALLVPVIVSLLWAWQNNTGGYIALGAFLFLMAAVWLQAVTSGREMFFKKGSAILSSILLITFLGGCAMAKPAPTATIDSAFEARDESKAASPGTSQANEPPRLRQYFPETMLWLPEAVTNPDGSLRLEFPVADSITTWRMTALASTQDGRLGSATAGLRVFQDFFVDLDLPAALTVGDEISVPVGVFNYLPEAQTVRLELERNGWFVLLDEPVKELVIEANDIQVVYFRLRAEKFGQQPLQVTALGTHLSDAIRKEVRVYPDGKQVTFSYSDRLVVGQTSQAVLIPEEAIAGTQGLVVKIYPGILSQVVEGLDSILRMPYGCFEQTSSTTYPNVLVLDYLKSTQQASPEAQMKAEEYINLGYQRLTTFEVGGSGGFSLFGNPPADRMLTAYGLQEFADMSRVHEVDPDMIRRAAEWLFSQQASDGSWENDRGLAHEQTWRNINNDKIPVTAYVTWALVEAGYGGDARTQKGLAYIRQSTDQTHDPYILALVANALLASDLASSEGISSDTSAVLARLAGLAVHESSGAYWESGVATFLGSEGLTGSIETTALSALALLRANVHPETANAALTFLVQQKDSFGTWYSTQATVLSLKALIESVRAGAEHVDAAVTVTLNGSQAKTLRISPDNFDVVQLIAFDDLNLGKENVVELKVEGEGNLMYQVSGSYYLAWDRLSQYADMLPSQDLVTIDISYDRSELEVDDTVQVQVQITLNQEGGQAESALIDLGLPPGFSVQTEDLAALVAYYQDLPESFRGARIERYELTGRQILIYLTNLKNGLPVEFSYRLRAKFPLTAQTPASSIYDYYNPDVSGESAPQTLTVVGE